MVVEPAVAGPSLALPRRRVDFDREVVCLLGLPFDAIGMSEAVRRVRSAAFANERCWISTPNLNFVVAARADAAFRDSVLQSDLSLADGMPLVWAARLLGLPLRERVAGSDLFEALQTHAGPPVGVYLFGGPPGAAEQAAGRINARGGGLVCVGFDAGGYGDVESLSDAATLARINASGARFVVVAMGARKGQAWIARNADRLAAPVLCHLGAVMNFAAGTLRRAPPWARRAGLEWLWRIGGEPGLWRRYAEDGRAALVLAATRLLPDALRSRGRAASAAPSTSTSTSAPASASNAGASAPRREHGALVVRMPDAASPAGVAALRRALTACVDEPGPVRLDLAGAGRVGHAFAGSLLLAQGWFGSRFTLVHAGKAARAVLRRMLAADALRGLEGEP